MGLELKVALADRLEEHVLFEAEISGRYVDAGDYVRDLIRQDMIRADQELAAVKAELQRAFAATESSYLTVTVDEVLARNGITREG